MKMLKIEHVANAMCLELANSINDRRRPTTDWLSSADYARAWMESLATVAIADLEESDLSSLVDFRQTVFDTFDALADERHPDPADLEALTVAHSEGLRLIGYVQRGETFTRDWPERWTVSTFRAAVADSAIRLLTETPCHRVKKCPGCFWLFLDTSKNGTRRWCSMAMCGGRAKAQRHYSRSRRST